MSLLAVLITFAAMAVFSGFLIAVATMRSAQISQELESWHAEFGQAGEPAASIEEAVVVVPRSSSIVYH